MVYSAESERLSWPARVSLVCLFTLVTFRGSYAQTCQETVARLTVSGGMQRIMASWSSVPDVAGYRVTIQETGSTVVQQQTDLDQDDTSVTFSNLLGFTSYDVGVAVRCVGGEVGMTVTMSDTTDVTAPTGTVSNFQYDVLNSLSLAVVNLSWTPLPEHQWNGVPLGYYVYLLRGGDRQFEYRVLYPTSSVVVSVDPGLYDVHIIAHNNQIVEDGEAFMVTGLQFGAQESSASPLEYPYFYILIPGVIFVVIAVVIVIVIVKKVHENNKRSVTFVRDIDNGSIAAQGFGNAVPMRDLSPHSPNTSTSIPVSSTVTSPAFSMQQQQHSFHQHLANRPLPLSPHGPALQPAEDYPPVFTAPPDSATYREIPSQLPMLEENPESMGFVPVPMSRTMTDPTLGAVFSPVTATATPPIHPIQNSVQQGAGHANNQAGKNLQQRGRSHTVAGLPSPYEVPDNTNSNGGTPSNEPFRPNSAHPQRGGGAMIPPPPSHSPPPFSSDIPHDHAHSPHAVNDPQQNTIPRTMVNKRSFSTSAAQGRSIAGKGMPYMKSEGNIHDPEMMDEFSMPPHAEEMEGDYTMPLGPESNNTGGFSHSQGAMDGGRHHSLERGKVLGYPNHHHQPQPYANQHQPRPQQQRSRHPGMINGALAASDQFGGFGITGEPVPPSMQNYPVPPMSAGDRDLKRESLFSETSTELSISSNGDIPSAQHRGGGAGGAAMTRGKRGSLNTDTSSASEKEFSPGWDYPRAPKSDMSRHSHNRGQRSRSPEPDDIKEIVV